MVAARQHSKPKHFGEGSMVAKLGSAELNSFCSFTHSLWLFELFPASKLDDECIDWYILQVYCCYLHCLRDQYHSIPVWRSLVWFLPPSVNYSTLQPSDGCDPSPEKSLHLECTNKGSKTKTINLIVIGYAVSFGENINLYTKSNSNMLNVVE